MMREYAGVRIHGLYAIESKTVKCEDLVIKAADQLLKKKQIKKEDISVLFYVTQSPRFLTPSTSFYIHKQLGLGKDCFQYDLNQGGTGFFQGLQLMSSIMMSIQEAKEGLLLLGAKEDETASAVAVLLTKEEDVKIYISNLSRGENWEMCCKRDEFTPWQITEAYHCIGKDGLQKELEKMREELRKKGIIPDEEILDLSGGNSIGLPLEMLNRRAGGIILAGAYGAGISISCGCFQMDESVYIS